MTSGLTVNRSDISGAPIVVVGAGLAGTAAAVVLGRQGCRVTLVDPKESYPSVFKAEKIEPEQAQLLRKLGLFDCLSSQAGRIHEVRSYYKGRLFRVSLTEQYTMSYADMVNALQTQLPATVLRKIGRVIRINNSEEIQRIRLDGGEELIARLVILACPLSPEIRAGLQLKRVVLQNDQSVTFGFTIARHDGRPFPFDALTYYGTAAGFKVDYLSLFSMRQAMRANLFTFCSAGDPWARDFIHNPHLALELCLPKLRNAIGEFRVIDRVETGHASLYRVEGSPVPGVVMIGDASQNTCPSTGIGLSKVFTDVDVLCSECVPQWFSNAGMGAEKLLGFCNHPRKTAMDAKALQDALYRRQACIDESWRWTVHRLRLRLRRRLESPSRRLPAATSETEQTRTSQRAPSTSIG